MFQSEEPDMALHEKLRLFLAIHWKGIVTLLTPIIMLFIILPLPAEKYSWVAYTLVIMAVYWVTECIPLGLTSFLPIITFPLAGIATTSSVCKMYLNDTIFMFLGSLLLAYSIEQCGLHKRMAFLVIRKVGYSHIKLLLALCCVTTFVSMWITNTAATTMMVPINFAILRVFESQGLLKIYENDSHGDMVASDITTCYFCAATFSATIGGIGTLVGTATNIAFKGLFHVQYPQAPELLSFPLFSAFSVPYMILLEAFCFITLGMIYFGLWIEGAYIKKQVSGAGESVGVGADRYRLAQTRLHQKTVSLVRTVRLGQRSPLESDSEYQVKPSSKLALKTKITQEGKDALKTAIENDHKKLGKFSFWEGTVFILFFGAMICFFCRSPQIFTGWGDEIKDFFGLPPNFVQDSALAMLVLSIMFILPRSLDFFKNCTAKYHEDLPKGRVGSVLDWNLLNVKMPWSFMFLLGGGFALADGAISSGMNEKLGELLLPLVSLPNSAVILMIALSVIIITNFASNVAVANVMVPIAMQVAKQKPINPLWYCIVAGFSASFCFMMPVGTPGNLIVQGAAKIPTLKMIKAGFGVTVSTLILTWFFMTYYAPVIWVDLNEEKPKWVPPT